METRIDINDLDDLELAIPYLIRQSPAIRYVPIGDNKRPAAEQKKDDDVLKVEANNFKVALLKHQTGTSYKSLNTQFEEIVKKLSSVGDEKIATEIKTILKDAIEISSTEVLLLIKPVEDNEINAVELLKKNKFMHKGLAIGELTLDSKSFSNPALATFLITLATQISYLLHWTESQTKLLNATELLGLITDLNAKPLLGRFSESINTYEKAPRLKRINLLGCSTAYFGKEREIAEKKAFLYYPSTEKDLEPPKKGEANYFLKKDGQKHLKLYKVGIDGAPTELKFDHDIILKKEPGNMGLFKVIPGKEKLSKIGLNEAQLQEIHKAIVLDLDSLEVTINGRQNLFFGAFKSKIAKKADLQAHLKGTSWENIYGHAVLPSTQSFEIKPLALMVGDKINASRILEDKAVDIKGYTISATAMDEKNTPEELKSHRMIIQPHHGYDALSRRGKSITFQYSKAADKPTAALIEEERINILKKKQAPPS